MSKDVLGKALLDFYNNEYSIDIVVRSSISEDDIIPIPYLFRSIKELPKIEEKALSLCIGNVLDVGAGSGCHSLILQENNVSIEAIDTSKGAVDVMIKRGVSAQMINFFDVEKKYDTLLFLMNGVGISGTFKGLELFLEKAKSLLNDNGQILLDSSDISYMFTEEDGSTWIDLNTSYYGEVVYQMEYKGNETDSFSWLFVDYNSLAKSAKSLGFKIEKVMDGEHHNYLARLWL